VANLRAIARQIGRIALLQQMLERLRLSMRMRKNSVQRIVVPPLRSPA